ncbi:MAG: hypothetical protein JXX14_22220 [Deltaproteobacteria bacterium]|nr:hypothetical protein [Deltaproteobacteria bacterium]
MKAGGLIWLSAALLVWVPSFAAFAFDEAAFISGEYDDGATALAGDVTPDGAQETAANDGAGTSDTSDGFRPSDSSDRLQLYGRIENQLTFVMMKDAEDRQQKHLYDYMQLRLDMDASLTGGMELKSDGVVRLFAGDTEISLDEVAPPETVARALAEDPRLMALLQTPYQFENRYWLDNAYVKIPVGDFLLTVGKQPLGQGAGYVWNPTDVFTQKDLLDPTYQQEGIIAMRLGVPMGRASLDLVLASPDDSMQHWMGGGRMMFPLGPFQFSAVSYYTRARFADVVGSMDAVMAAAQTGQNPEDAIQIRDDKRVMFGGDMVVDIKGVRVWSEAAYNYLPSGRDWLEAEGGVEYYFPFETHLMIEYFYYERSPLQQHKQYDLNGWMNALDGHLKMLGRHFLFTALEHQVSDFWTLGVSTFQGMSDASAMVEGDIRWSFAEGAELWLMAAKGFGDRGDFLTNSFQSWLRLTIFY